MIESIFKIDKSNQMMIAIPIIVLIAIVLIYYGINSFNKGTSAISEFHEQLANAKLFQEQHLAGGEEVDDEIDDVTEGGGETDKYLWSQTTEDVEVSIPLQPFAPIHKNEINVKITNKQLKVILRRENYLEDEFFSVVLAEDCCWYLDNNNAEHPFLHLSLVKGVQGKDSTWDYVLEKDSVLAKKKKIKIPKGGDFPPIHNIDPNDPASLKAALNALKQK